MRRLPALSIILLLAALPLAAQGAPSAVLDASYGIGMYFASNVKSSGLELDLDAFVAGFKDYFTGKPTRLTEEAAATAIRAAFAAAEEKRAAANLAAGREFLAANMAKPGVKTTASGLQYQVLVEGKGAKPKAGDVVTVNYEGRLIDGTVFDSSYENGEPLTFGLDEVIPGWSEGVQLMSVGSKYRLWIPAELAYGAEGAGEVIAPNSALIFEVELVSIGK